MLKFLNIIKSWQIFLSEPVKVVLEKISNQFTFDDIELPNEFKGISTPPTVYELKDIPKERIGRICLILNGDLKIY